MDWIEDLGPRVEETRLDVEKKKKNRDVEPEHGKVRKDSLLSFSKLGVLLTPGFWLLAPAGLLAPGSWVSVRVRL